jgi:hypothetical protein
MRIDSRRQEDGKPVVRQRGRWSARLLAVLIAVLGAMYIGIYLATPAAADSFVKSIEEDHGTYYRLKVKLAYKGQPQDFDIVVGCNVRQINYGGGGGRTYEVGLVPTVFGRRMDDSKGLVVRPPDACDGRTTANGKVQPDLLPVIVVYDDAETLSFGTAYLSEDAYESPLSVLAFGGATIEKATKSEFDEFRRTRPNLVKRESYFSPLDSDDELRKKNFRRLTRPFGHACQGYMRFRIPEDVRPLVRQRWPDGHPTYWKPDTDEQQYEITRQIWGRKQILTDRPNDVPRNWHHLMEMIPEYTANRGLATRAGGGLASQTRGTLFPPSIYPATDDNQSHRWPADPAQWPAFLASKEAFAASDVDFRGGQTRGFAYCSALSRVPKTAEVMSDLTQKRRVFRIDGQDVVSKQSPLAANVWIFERDEYVFHAFDIALDSTRGDI